MTKNCDNCSWLKIYPNPKRIYPNLGCLFYCEQSYVSRVDLNERINNGENLEEMVCPHWTDDWVK